MSSGPVKARRPRPVPKGIWQAPIATIVHLVVVIAACVKWTLGEFDSEDREVLAVLLGSNALLGVGRGLANRR